MRKLAVSIMIAFLLAFPSAGTAIAGPLEEIAKAFEQGDYATAYRLTKVQAEKGSAKAQNVLGYLYQSGQGVERDYAEALRWYMKAANQGDAEAQNNVGVMYENGHGVWQDYSEAANWYARAAKQGIPRAQNNLGILYAVGRGVPQDFATAYVWFHLAASLSPPSDQEYRLQAVGNRELAAEKLSPGQLAEALRLAQEWKPMKERQAH
jgi:TPR repeat protein